MAILTALRRLLGYTGHLPPKYKPSPALERAQRTFLKGAPPAAGGQWVTDCCFDELSRVMGRAWVGTAKAPGEAAKEWMTSHVHYPDALSQEQLAVYYMGSSIAQAMRRGAVILAARQEEDVISALIFSERRCISDQRSSYKDPWWELGVTLRLADFSLPKLMQCPVYQGQQGLSLRKASALSDMKQGYHDTHRPKYWSIEMVAIDPEQQGRGLGKVLLQRFCVLADDAGMACYLEAAGPKNANFYRSCGFYTVQSLSVADPTDSNGHSLRVDIMRRLPTKLKDTL